MEPIKIALCVLFGIFIAFVVQDVVGRCKSHQFSVKINAVPVVRCRDCIYKERAAVSEKGYLICPASGMEITDQDYCSYGERK